VPFLVLTPGRTRLSWRALALGLAGFVVVGIPWYLALWAQDPGVLRYFLETQLLGRLTGTAQGVHPHPPYYLLVAWPLALAPWTPLIVLALWRLRPRAGWRHADPVDLYLLLGSIVPVLFFSIPRSKLPTYLLVAFPAAVLALGRALEQGLLADRAARRALAACAALACGMGLVLALGLLVSQHLPSGTLDTKLLVGRPLFAAALVAVSALLATFVHRFAQQRAAIGRTLVTIALGMGLVLVVGYGAIGPAMPSLRDEGLIARSVPGAWLIQSGLRRASALYYFGDTDRFRFTGVRARPKSKAPPGPYDEQRLPAEEALALLRGAEPVFCLTKPKYLAELVEPTGSAVILRRAKTVLLANRAAQAALLLPTRAKLAAHPLLPLLAPLAARSEEPGLR
jgi:4-amino-4-deoxy-L-arabinose transferase-like glycosyltransferase